ncbi:MAG: HlyC/CorC family transporter [Reyranellaceae bacterium]
MIEKLLTPEVVVPLVAACIGVAAFLSSSRAALTHTARPRMHRLAQLGNRRARLVGALIDRRDDVIGALRLGNLVVNVAIASLTTALMASMYGIYGVIYAAALAFALILVLGEILPRSLTQLGPDRVALFLAPAIELVASLLGPVMEGGARLVRGLLRLPDPRLRPDRDAAAREQLLRGAIDLHDEAGDEKDAPDEKKMLRSVLDLADRTVASVMVPRGNVEALNAALPVARLVELVLASPHTRIPLYRGQPENITGVVHAKALFRAVHRHEGSLDQLSLQGFVTAPWYILDTTSLLDQLQAFKRRREHFAVVVDEYGGLQGVVTLEDILEEIVGEIDDETDVRVAGVEARDDGSFICLGQVPVRDLNREFGWRLPEDVATTIAGIVLHEARRIPEVGQSFAFHGFRFEVLGREGNRIARLKVIPPLPAAPSPL